MKREDFEDMSVAEKGMVIMSEGKHLTQVMHNNQLLNLYSVNDFFIEVYYSMHNNQIDKIEIINDLSRIDLYIDGNVKKEKLHLD